MGSAGRGVQRIVPDACPELIVQLGDRFERRVGGRWRRQPALFVAGTLTAPWLLRPGPTVRTFGARFRPGAIRALQRLFRRELGISPKRFARIVRLNALLATLDAGERDSAVDLARNFTEPKRLRRMLAAAFEGPEPSHSSKPRSGGST